jgi:hypothetical protein
VKPHLAERDRYAPSHYGYPREMDEVREGCLQSLRLQITVKTLIKGSDSTASR